MKKQHFEAKSLLTQLILSACAFGALSSNAWAQATDGAAQPQAQAGAAATTLPVITSNRVESRPQSTAPRNVPIPAKAPGQFETYVSGVTGDGAKIFGGDLFGNAPTTFAPFDAAQVNQDYVIGTGDELQIRGWGMVNIDVTAKVDRSGAIYIPRVGSVSVSGVKYRDLQAYLKQAVGKIFTNFDLTASISQVRSVQIYVVGHAVRPGTFTLSAMSTLLNALFTVGGPDATGSMRNIQVKRGQQTVTTFDIYDMLMSGDKSRDITLQDGDVVYIPEVGPQVALLGNVKRPAIFELKGSATMADLVGWAGGFDSSAALKQVIIEKNVNNEYLTVATITADQASVNRDLGRIPLAPADVLRVFAPGSLPISAEIRNEYVRISGEVKQSGVFQIRSGETLRELVTRLGGVTGNAYVYATELDRESVKRAQQAKLNEVADRFLRDLDSGATQQLGATSDKDSIAIISATVERQRAIAQKMATVKARGRIVLEMENGDAQVKNLPDIALRAGDTIYIPRKPDTVDVLGAVFQQNSFIYRASRNLGDYVGLAGGPSQTADASQIYVIRADGTTQSNHSSSWFSGGIKGSRVNPGDTIVVPEEIVHTSFAQSLKEWTSIFYQFGLGAAGLKVLKN